MSWGYMSGANRLRRAGMVPRVPGLNMNVGGRVESGDTLHPIMPSEHLAQVSGITPEFARTRAPLMSAEGFRAPDLPGY